MKACVEVCVDSLESLHNAQRGGANRIELCSALALGGLTPSAGFMKKAAAIANMPVYAMIRPRQGDFLYSQDDVEQMLSDIFMARQAGLAGIVIGALKADGSIDQDILKSLIAEAKGLGITFHRAIDHCDDLYAGLDIIMSAGCERVLSSGQAPTALSGCTTLAEMVTYCGNHLSVMAGAGISSDNVLTVITKTGVNEVHLSGKTVRPSAMDIPGGKNNRTITMGNIGIDELAIPVTDTAKILNIVRAVQSKTPG